MRISAWATVTAIGFAGSILAAGCVVGDDGDDDNKDGGSGSGGVSGSGGSSGSGGTAGRGGTSGSGGSAGTAGSGGTGGGPVNCMPAAGDDTCDTCMKTRCCAELLACAADEDCQGDGELTCIQDCAFAAADGGVINDQVLSACAGQCANQGSTVSEATSDAVACMNSGTRQDGASGDDCFVDCLSGS